jgi:methylenetetrahydrofolate reductase (NADPH)
MLEDLAGRGCDRPVLPGVMPFTSVEGLRRMAGMNCTTIPADLDARLERTGGDADAVRELGVEVATDLCRRLERAGAPGVHLYTLNRAASVTRIWRNLDG